MSCEEFVIRIARYLIELGVVRRMLGEMQRYLIELRAVRSLLGEVSEVFERVVSCKEFDRRIARYLIELEL